MVECRSPGTSPARRSRGAGRRGRCWIGPTRRSACGTGRRRRTASARRRDRRDRSRSAASRGRRSRSPARRWSRAPRAPARSARPAPARSAAARAARGALRSAWARPAAAARSCRDHPRVAPAPATAGTTERRTGTSSSFLRSHASGLTEALLAHAVDAGLAGAARGAAGPAVVVAGRQIHALARAVRRAGRAAGARCSRTPGCRRTRWCRSRSAAWSWSDRHTRRCTAPGPGRIAASALAHLRPCCSDCRRCRSSAGWSADRRRSRTRRPARTSTRWRRSGHMHTPAVQLAPCAHWLPQVPQLRLSVCRFAQPLLQLDSPVVPQALGELAGLAAEAAVAAGPAVAVVGERIDTRPCRT